MLVVNYDPKIGWCAPEIKPYGPLAFDPMSSCFQYGSNVFEGMKVKYYALNALSTYFLHNSRPTRDLTERRGYFDRRKIWNVSNALQNAWLCPLVVHNLPSSIFWLLMQLFDEQALLVLIQQLIKIESRWIPSIPDHSLYVRPTFIGTRAGK